MSEKNISCALELHRLVFDSIKFDRYGFKNDNQVKYTLEATFSENKSENIFRANLVLSGEKSEEYAFSISVSGYFSIENSNEIDEAVKQDLVTKNAASIIMPYLRSQVTLLTAQPEVDCVVLPPFNINSMLNAAQSEAQAGKQL